MVTGAVIGTVLIGPLVTGAVVVGGVAVYAASKHNEAHADEDSLMGKASGSYPQSYFVVPKIMYFQRRALKQSKRFTIWIRNMKYLQQQPKLSILEL